MQGITLWRNRCLGQHTLGFHKAGTPVTIIQAVYTYATAAGGYEATWRTDSTDVLDRYILARLGDLVREVRADLEGLDIAGSGALRDGRLYVGNYGNKFQCVDVNEGRIVWEYSFREFAFYAAPALLGERVVVGGRDKHLHCLNAADGKVLWRVRAGNRIDSSPVICGNKIVFGCDDGRLYLVALDDGRELWTHDLGKPVSASPAVSDGRIVIGGTDGRVVCFGPAK